MLEEQRRLVVGGGFAFDPFGDDAIGMGYRGNSGRADTCNSAFESAGRRALRNIAQRRAGQGPCHAWQNSRAEPVRPFRTAELPALRLTPGGERLSAAWDFGGKSGRPALSGTLELSLQLSLNGWC